MGLCVSSGRPTVFALAFVAMPAIAQDSGFRRALGVKVVLAK